MTDDEAVRVASLVGLDHGTAYTQPRRPQCLCGFKALTFDTLRRHIAAAYVDAARPIIEAEAIRNVAEELYRDDPEFDALMGYAGTVATRAVVRTEPDQ